MKISHRWAARLSLSLTPFLMACLAPIDSVPSPPKPNYPRYLALQAGTAHSLPVTMASPANWSAYPSGIAEFEFDRDNGILTVNGLRAGFAQWDPALPEHHAIWVAVLNDARSKPILIAHHGLPNDAPENTLASVLMACASSIPGIEVDLRFTLDSVPVLIHDRSVSRTTNGTGNVDEMTLAEVMQLDAGQWFGSQFIGERIPTLGEFLSLSSACDFDLIQLDVKSFLPIGTDSGWTRIARELNRQNLLSRTELAAGLNELRRANVLIPGARRLLFTNRVSPSLANAILADGVQTVGVAYPGFAASLQQLRRLDSSGVVVGVWGTSHVLQLDSLIVAPSFVTTDWRWLFLH
jgi:glycerophosphoryl diester phosphodiesterase